MKRVALHPMSDKQAKRQAYLHVLADFLTEWRAYGICEIGHFDWKLDPHHIIRRSAGRVDSIENIVMIGRVPHDKLKRLSRERAEQVPVELQKLVKERNEKCGITERTTGGGLTEWLVFGEVKASARWPG